MWLQWAISTLDKVVNILRQYFTSTVSEYQEQSHVNCIEIVISKFDRIDGPLVRIWNADLRHEVHMAYIRYHSKISYHVTMQVGNLFIPDDAMVLFTGPFDNSPNASHINPILAPGIINPFDFEDQIIILRTISTIHQRILFETQKLV